MSRSRTRCSGAGTTTAMRSMRGPRLRPDPLPRVPARGRAGWRAVHGRGPDALHEPAQSDRLAGGDVRAGTDADGMPIGVQVAARRWEDEVALAAAAVVEAAC